MEQSPSSKANSSSASQDILRISWNPAVRYRVHKSPSLVSILSQFNPVTLTSYFFKIRATIILPSTPRSSKWSLPFRFPHQNPVCTSPLPDTCHMLHPPSHPSWYNHPNNIWWRIQSWRSPLWAGLLRYSGPYSEALAALFRFIIH